MEQSGTQFVRLPKRMQLEPEKLRANIRSALRDEHLRAAVLKAADHSLAKRAEVVAEVADWEALREEAALRRDRTLNRLADHLERLEKRLQEKGVQVHWAADGEEANRIAAEICEAARKKSGNPRPIVAKSKSMTTEEIGLTAYLEGKGFEVVETDLGEYIVQIAGQTPSHITAPALHLSRQDVGRIFVEKLGMPYTDDPVELIGAARRKLRGKFLQAEVGVTGANFAVAQTGTPLIVENEGNGRLVGAIPRTQIILMGIEKVVASWEDLLILLELLPRSATGQRATGSVLFFNRPRKGGETDGPEEMHLIILDNGRSRLLADAELRSVLRCIRCGACLNACPVYRRVGGHAYGWIYPGPIGSVLAPMMLGLERAADHPFASSLCGKCAEICPVKIDLPRQLLTLRARVKASPPTERAFWLCWRGLMNRPDAYRAAAEIPRFLLYDLLGGRWSPSLPVWSRDREAPWLAEQSFRESFAREFPEGVV
jgi:L-lactate dehydrogenase complex protein LldF